jgi:hypothetical protein
MKSLFSRAVLVATLFTGSVASVFGEQTPPIDPTSGDSVKTFALEWFEHLQAGQIDRSLMTRELSETLTDDSVNEMSRIVASFGPATKDEIVENRKIDDQTFYVVKLFLQRGDAVSLLIGFNESGKITGVTFPSLGQE